jgi:hypothetical protein
MQHCSAAVGGRVACSCSRPGRRLSSSRRGNTACEWLQHVPKPRRLRSSGVKVLHSGVEAAVPVVAAAGAAEVHVAALCGNQAAARVATTACG